MYDSIVIGAGPSGLTAAIYLARYERKTLILSEDVGGQAVVAGEIENYPGFKHTTGVSLMMDMKSQAEAFDNITIKTGESLQSISKVGNTFKVETNNGEFEAKTVIMCAGKRPRQLGLKNESDLVGKGLSYCATCDGQFARNKKTVIIGGGYAATEAALILEKVASEVTIINLNKNLSGEQTTLKKVQENKKINVINNANTTEIKTENSLISSIVYKDVETKKSGELKAQMVFVEIGSVPNTEAVKDFVRLNDRFEIVVDPKTRSTSVDGVFAAGDITDTYFKQIIVAAGDGASSAISANQYLEKYH